MTDNLPAPRDKHARLTPITGLQPIWRSAYQIEHAGSTWTVDADYFDWNEKLRLYRDGALVETQASPATFEIGEGARIEAALAMYGMKRARLVVDGQRTQLVPMHGSIEHHRATLKQEHPGWSRAISVTSFMVLVLALVIALPQYVDWITHAGWWPWGEFNTPLTVPDGLANTLGVLGVLAGLERGASMRHNPLLDD